MRNENLYLAIFYINLALRKKDISVIPSGPHEEAAYLITVNKIEELYSFLKAPVK